MGHVTGKGGERRVRSAGISPAHRWQAEPLTASGSACAAVGRRDAGATLGTEELAASGSTSQPP